MNEITLIYEILAKVVTERSGVVWTVPFTKEISSRVCAEVLETKYFICNN